MARALRARKNNQQRRGKSTPHSSRPYLAFSRRRSYGRLYCLSLGCGRATVERTRKRCVLEGMDPALSEKARPGGKPKLTGVEEDIVVALACSESPDERCRWTLRLLADKAVQLIDHNSLSCETVRRTLKKTRLSLAA